VRRRLGERGSGHGMQCAHGIDMATASIPCQDPKEGSKKNDSKLSIHLLFSPENDLPLLLRSVV
jgi:hypothetical protein